MAYRRRCRLVTRSTQVAAFTNRQLVNPVGARRQPCDRQARELGKKA